MLRLCGRVPGPGALGSPALLGRAVADCSLLLRLISKAHKIFFPPNNRCCNGSRRQRNMQGLQQATCCVARNYCHALFHYYCLCCDIGGHGVTHSPSRRTAGSGGRAVAGRAVARGPSARATGARSRDPPAALRSGDGLCPHPQDAQLTGCLYSCPSQP